MTGRMASLLHCYPHYRMNVFSGTNTIEEFHLAAKALLISPDEEDAAKRRLLEVHCRELLSVPGVYAFAAGRMALYAGIRSMGLQSGDEIILPSFTCVVVPNAMLYAGVKPVYCDISLKDFNIDVAKIQSLIGPRTKAIYAQHTFGRMCDIAAIQEIARRHNLIVIEDAALALGARIGSKYAGTFGDFGFYSTDRSKVINAGVGGILVTGKQGVVERMDALYAEVPELPGSLRKRILFTFLVNLMTLHPRCYWLGKYVNAVLARAGLLTYFTDELSTVLPQKGYPYPAKMPGDIAMIGLSQLQSLNSNIARRRSIAAYYNDLLGVYTPSELHDEKNIFLRYSFLVKNRAKWIKLFKSRIDLGLWFTSIAEGRTTSLEDILYAPGTNRVSEFATQHIINLPTHRNIRPELLRKQLIELKMSGDILTNWS